MRLYGRKFADRFVKKRVNISNETRDGILWDLDWINHIARVKIQGSSEYVNCYFPRNEATIPSWMKPGNAVRIVHRAGNRGFSEITGHGLAIPTPASGPDHPPTSDLADGIISGCEISITSPESMFVIISDGIYRINGDIYILHGNSSGYAVMNESSPSMTMNESYPPAFMGQTEWYYTMNEASPPITMNEPYPPATMGDGYDLYEVDSAPAGNNHARYDTFVAGEDGIVDYIKGVESTSPSKPAIPGDHIQLSEYILVYQGMTEILQSNIGQQFTAREIAGIIISAIDEFTWDAGDNYPETNITVTTKDQYDWNLSGSWTIILNMISGTGQVYSSQSGYDGDYVTQQFSGSSYTFKYQRDQTDVESSLVLMATLNENGSISTHDITLLNSAGLPVQGGTSANELFQLVTVPGSGTVTIDWTDGHVAEIIVDRDMTLGFSNAYSGDKLVLRLRMDGTGGWTVTLPSETNYGIEITTEVISNVANKKSYLGFIYDATSDKYDIVANVSGY